MTHFIAGLVALIWICLVGARGGFWRASERHDLAVPQPPDAWPDVTAVVPARDEAETIGRAVGSLLSQHYPGRLNVVLVDDGSSDATASEARVAADSLGAGERLTITAAGPPAPGWTGKVWALQQGYRLAAARLPPPDYLLLTDADITHAPSALRDLVSRAAAGGHVLTSVMARLRCRSFAERAAIPAFVFFFQMLYPFAWVNRRDRATVAAAGGCMLVRTESLREIRGFRAMPDALIDDCALARQLASHGPLWLGLSDSVHSIRRYQTFRPIARMVMRSAYTELKHSPLRLFASMLGMALIFLAPPLLIVFAPGSAAVLGLFAYALMVLSFQPILRLYRLSPLWGLAVPIIAAVYMVWTLGSALEHARGRGGSWKGRLPTTAGGAR